MTITDANVFLGRLIPDYFPKIFGKNEDKPLDVEIVATKFTDLTKLVNKESGNDFTPEEVATGYVPNNV